MKQEITKKQWDELDNNKKSKLIKTFGWKQLDNSYKYIDGSFKYVDDSYEYWGFITIGLLIEFLGINLLDMAIARWWYVKINFKPKNILPTMDVSIRLELIDALWEATKKKLN